MIQMAQDFMDILRIKKEDDDEEEGAVTEAPEFVGPAGNERRIDPSEKEGKTGTELVDEERRKKEREAKEEEELAEADKKRKLESATTISMWKEILERYSKTNDVSDPSMRGTIREFSKSYLIPRSTSKNKIDNFYQSIITQEADPELLKLFFDDAKDLGIEISGDTSGVSIDLSKVEREYNGRQSLEVLRSFFEDAAGIKRSVLTGQKMSDSAFRKIKEMLRDTQSIDVDELGTNPSVLLSQFRQLVLTLDRLKEEQEKTLSKAESTIDAKDKTWEYKPQDDEEDITGGFSYLGESSVFDNFRSVAKTVSQIIDKIEEMLQHVLDLRNMEEDSDKANVFDNTRKKMIQLVKVTVGNFEFIVGEDELRAIKIN